MKPIRRCATTPRICGRRRRPPLPKPPCRCAPSSSAMSRIRACASTRRALRPARSTSDVRDRAAPRHARRCRAGSICCGDGAGGRRSRRDAAGRRLAGLPTPQGHCAGGGRAAPLLPRHCDAVEQEARALDRASRRLDPSISRLLIERRQRLSAGSKLLASLSYRGVLARGFALVTDDTGEIVRSASAIAPVQPLSLEFVDGRVAVTAA